MSDDVARDTHCEITINNYIARDIHCDGTMSNDIVMYTYQGITVHNDIVIKLFYYIFSALCLIVLFCYGFYGTKTRKPLCLISLGRRTYD